MLAACMLMVSTAAVANVATIVASRDTTLFEDAQNRSNGVGIWLYVGVIGSGSPRRSPVRFDLSGIPAGSTVNTVTFRFEVSRQSKSPGPGTLSLHRLLADWGESTSDSSGGGQGAAAAPGDATWINRLHPGSPWFAGGGDFAAASATVPVVTGAYVVPSTAALVADVQGWLTNPSSNFGWMMVGNEAGDYTARLIHSRESAVVAARPTLTVDFTPPGSHGGGGTQVPFMPAWAFALLAGAMAAIAAWRRR